MMAEAPQRPTLESKAALEAPQLPESLTNHGAAALQIDQSLGSGDPNGPLPRSAKDGSEARDFGSYRSRSEPVMSEPGLTDDSADEAIEDYDDLKLNPDTLVANSRKSLDGSTRPDGPNMTSDDSFSSRRKSETGVNSKPERRESIQIRLEKTDRKGRYILTADDPDIKEILRKGIEREQLESAGKLPRTRFRDLLFTRQFTTFDRQNPASAESPFFGFFTLFWLAMVLIFFQVAMHNWRDYGSILGRNQIAKMMFSHDLFLLGVTDAVMCAATAEGWLFQKVVQKGWVSWSKGGWIVQNIWQSAYLATVIWWTWFREWPWPHSIFVLIHALVFLMKQHSYAFYNGYLSGVYRRRKVLQRRLQELEEMEPSDSRPTSPASPERSSTSTGVDQLDLKRDGKPKKRRPSMGIRTSTNFNTEKSDVASVASAIASGQPLDAPQMQAFREVMQSEIDDLTRELQGKSQAEAKAYPRNLTLGNHAEFICLPTLVYELEYPRQDRINWWYVLEKTVATFGTLCVMMVISQAFIYPPVAKTVQMKEAGMPIEERWREFPYVVSDMLFPLLIEQLLTWYVIWECILNVLAEVTRFADRGFYGDWWNSVSWDQYARDWNRPVHNFLLRHVYHSSISTFRLSKTSATFITFLLSALVHELCMAVLFKKVRGYLFTMQLLQMPLVMLSRTKLLKGRNILGNVIFWLGLFVGPSFLTSLYLII